MEYTKDMILHVNYGQTIEKKKAKWNVLERLSNTIAKHKMLTTIVSITLMLMILDIMLITSFVQILSSIV